MARRLHFIFGLTTSLLFLLLVNSAVASTVTQHEFGSQMLGRSYHYTIYQPPGYEGSDLNYPVFYLLHGASGNADSWARAGNIQETVDTLIAAGTIEPMLIVMPADPNFWWADSALESAQSALIHELIPYIDENYRTISSREGRLIGGYSAGGFGSVNAALRYPELFAAVAALSPAVYDPAPPPSSSAVRAPVFQTEGEFDSELWRSLSWVSLFDAYRQQDIIVPFFINSGDHDRFDIAYHASAFFQALREHQGQAAALRIFDGDHNFAAWGGSIGEALEYMSQFLLAPR